MRRGTNQSRSRDVESHPEKEEDLQADVAKHSPDLTQPPRDPSYWTARCRHFCRSWVSVKPDLIARLGADTAIDVFNKSAAELVDVVDTPQRAISVIQKETGKQTAFLLKIVVARNMKDVVTALTAVVDAPTFEYRQAGAGGAPAEPAHSVAVPVAFLDKAQSECDHTRHATSNTAHGCDAHSGGAKQQVSYGRSRGGWYVRSSGCVPRDLHHGCCCCGDRALAEAAQVHHPQTGASAVQAYSLLQETAGKELSSALAHLSSCTTAAKKC